MTGASLGSWEGTHAAAPAEAIAPESPDADRRGTGADARGGLLAHYDLLLSSNLTSPCWLDLTRLCIRE